MSRIKYLNFILPRCRLISHCLPVSGHNWKAFRLSYSTTTNHLPRQYWARFGYTLMKSCFFIPINHCQSAFILFTVRWVFLQFLGSEWIESRLSVLSFFSSFFAFKAKICLFISLKLECLLVFFTLILVILVLLFLTFILRISFLIFYFPLVFVFCSC